MHYNRYKERNLTILLIVLILVAVGVMIGIGMSGNGLTDPESARRVLTESGYTDIQITGYRAFGGSESDWYITEFRATSPNGNRVSGVVTKGAWRKGNTIRLD